ncbi:hypothetical protein ACFLTN_05595 [Chloroflexota bacterium]
MTALMKMLTKPAMMWLCGSLGDALVIVGIVTAALNEQIAGFTPLTWIVLALVCYFYFIISIAARIMVSLEGKAKK